MRGAAVLETLRYLVGGYQGPLTREDRHRWAAARSLADLGELTADWLDGRIASQPGYWGTVDVDEDLAPGLTAALIAANRAGYVTNSSQGGFHGAGWRGAHCHQLAWVSGLAVPVTADALAVAAHAGGYTAHLWQRGDARVPVTTAGGRTFTSDTWMPPSVLRCEVYEGVGPLAMDAVLAAQQLTIIDSQPGRNTIWAWLKETAAAVSLGCTERENGANAP